MNTDTKWLTEPNRDLIYHYTTCDKLFEGILESGILKFGKLTNTNDPFEKEIWSFTASYDWSDPKCNATFARASVLSQNIQTEAHVFCTSRDDDWHKGYAIPSLWAHYAGKHKGVCLVLDKEKLIASIKEQYPNVDWLRHQDITYELDEYEMERAFHFIIQGGEADNIVNKHIKKHEETLFFGKDISWKYEQEFRIVILTKDKECIEIPIENDFLKGIVLGSDFPTCYLPSIEAFAEKHTFEVMTIHWLNGIHQISHINFPRLIQDIIEEELNSKNKKAPSSTDNGA